MTTLKPFRSFTFSPSVPINGANTNPANVSPEQVFVPTIYSFANRPLSVLPPDIDFELLNCLIQQRFDSPVAYDVWCLRNGGELLDARSRGLLIEDVVDFDGHFTSFYQQPTGISFVRAFGFDPAFKLDTKINAQHFFLFTRAGTTLVDWSYFGTKPPQMLPHSVVSGDRSRNDMFYMSGKTLCFVEEKHIINYTWRPRDTYALSADEIEACRQQQAAEPAETAAAT